MNTARRAAICIIVTLFAALGALAATVSRPTAVFAQAEPSYGFVAGQARATLEQDWDKNPSAITPERLYRVTKDSAADWSDGAVHVRYVLAVVPVEAKRADPVSIRPVTSSSEPTVHTHGPFCTLTRWGVDYESCSWSRPESQQCFPSVQDRATQLQTGHRYDVVQCGRDQFVFFEPRGE